MSYMVQISYEVSKHALINLIMYLFRLVEAKYTASYLLDVRYGF